MQEKNLTWNLTDMFADQAAWEKQLTEVRALGEQLAARQGHAADSPEALFETARIYEALGEKASQNAVYAYCTLHTDMAAQAGRDMTGRLEMLMTEISEKTAFLAPELMTYTMEDFERYRAALPALEPYTQLARDLFAQKAHILDGVGEAMLARLGDLQGGYQQVFEDLTVNDTPFPEIDGPEGEKVAVNEAGYGAALHSPDRAFRKQYFNTLLGLYGGHIHTLSSAYYGSVKGDVYHAKSRNYPSARAAALAGNHIPEDVYDNLIQTVHEGLAPLQDYVAFRAERLGVQDLHFYDLFVPLTPGDTTQYGFQAASALVREALKPLGEDYDEILAHALEDRWIDVMPQKGKRSGAYSTGAYGFHPYMLLNYDHTLEDVFTLAHELGHSMHTHYSNQAQPYVYADYSIFCAEVASITNEQLLYHHLLENSPSKPLRALLLTKHLDDLRSTFYRQTLFAEFERETHAMVERGEPLTPQALCALHKRLNTLYYGEKLVVDDTLSYEWARIPHYYSAFYVYQYATGLAAAIAISRRILSGVPGAVEDYKTFLKGGSSRHPIDLLRLAGVDMASPAPIADTVQEFADTLQKLRETL